ncbi:MAG: hypothetical protein CM1200mP14_09120 [Gammaproteobacteria bacterium]|nr:MAG: hypothetical protein CM1200mP14_09120 [Gammaproteobacteria bacterium]
MAIASAEQMGQAQQQSGENAAEQLEQLAQEQGEVMNQTGQLMPMELGQQAMAQQMQELAQAKSRSHPIWETLRSSQVLMKRRLAT